MATKNGKATAIGPATNAAEEDISSAAPYTAVVRLVGTSDMLFHRWNVEAVAEKAAAKKGSAAKKSDNVESYVYRNDEGQICIPGEYLRMAVIGASKFRQDPRSPRKSAMDLFKAGVVPLTALAVILVKGEPVTEWEYEHRCRVQVQRAGITRCRPAFKAGWQAEIELMINTPEHISPAMLHDVLIDAGRLIGLADFRPTYGRFQVSKFETDRE